MITLEVLAGEKAGATFELDLPVLTHRARAVQSGGAVRLSPVGRARADLPRGRSLHLSRPEVDQRLARAARRRRDLARRRHPRDHAHRRRSAAPRRPDAAGGAALPRARSRTTGAVKQEIIAQRDAVGAARGAGQGRARSGARGGALQRGQEARAARARSGGGVRGRGRGDLRAGAQGRPTSRIDLADDPTAA